MGIRLAKAAAATAIVLVGVAACDQPAGPVAEMAASAPSMTASSGPTLVECPTDDSSWSEGTIGSLGGSVTLGGHRLDVPRLGVIGLHSFKLTDPAAQYMLLDLKGDGAESFGFREAATITIDYSRCTRSNIDNSSLTVWKVDPETKALLREMGGVDDKVARTITFTTDSLSVYSLAN